MPLVNRNSTAIADMVASPKVLVNPSKGAAGHLMEVAGYVANAADDSQNSVFRFCRVSSNVRISQVILAAQNATAGAVNVGVHQTADNGGAVVDADLFGSAVALTSSALTEGVDITYESNEYTFAESVQPLWQVLGLTSDPNREYDITATVSTDFNAAGVGMLMKVRYVA